MKKKSAKRKGKAVDKFASNIASEPMPSKRHIPSIPIHRHAFKGKYLQKHASLLKNSQLVNGLLISCSTTQETRAIGQARTFVQVMMDRLFPGSTAQWPDITNKLDIEMEFIEKKPKIPTESNIHEGDGLNAEDEKVVLDEKKKDKKFQLVDTGCAGIIFIRFRSDVKPSDFIMSVMDSLYGQTLENARLLESISSCSRFIPIEHVCPANLIDITKLVQPIILDFFSMHKNSSVCVMAENRNNSDLSTNVLKQTVIGCLPNEQGLTVDLKDPEYTLLISVFKSVAGFSILSNYLGKYKKYNLHGYCKQVIEPVLKAG